MEITITTMGTIITITEIATIIIEMEGVMKLNAINVEEQDT
jgi:hypothetical protein